MEKCIFDIRECPQTLDKINEILNERGTAEIHNEIRKDGNGGITRTVIVVRTTRSVENREIR